MATEATDADGEDPIDYFLEDMTYHGKTERTRAAYERVLRRFERFLADREATIGSAGQRECMAFVHELRRSCAPSTVATYASYLHRFYAYMSRAGALEANPMTLVMEELDESVDTDPARREIDLPSMRSFLAGIGHPLDRTVVLTLLKTGIRVGELCNLDLRDLHLDGGVRETFGTVPRGALDGRPDSLFVPADPSRGEVYNDERRQASNKRERDTVIPVDAELRRALRQWLAARPDPRSDADPLFVSTREWGRRVTPGMVRKRVERYARDAGWYREGGDAAENVTPHYFRHFFTTHLRDRTGDRGIVKYLR
ncbi:MAG: tyrosine-type recombinase/integrase, partial [Haloarculaceae archaeon]